MERWRHIGVVPLYTKKYVGPPEAGRGKKCILVSLGSHNKVSLMGWLK